MSPDYPESIRAHISQPFRTLRNIFGLSRQYLSDKVPSHDPEEHLSLEDLFDEPPTMDYKMADRPDGDCNPFFPYPNRSSYRLGDWYWNGGAQKSHKSFKELVSIIGDPEFRPEDIRRTKWREIDAELGANDADGNGKVGEEDEKAEWLDEDAGWTKNPITISVPFPRNATNPGPKNFVAGDLYYRPLVSVIREKITNPQDMPNFHYEPFELLWKPNDAGSDQRVQGELYTSPAFLDAHRDLQESPGEPGCRLPRVVVAMMFWSDATLLTSFGNTKLWPCYLFFGNESKYL